MLVKDVRQLLEPFSELPVIWDFDGVNWRHTYLKVKDFLTNDEFVFHPKCWEVLYDWDEKGYGDGHDTVCFYSEDEIGYLHRNYKAARAYNPGYLDELTKEAEEEYRKEGYYGIHKKTV